MSSLTTGVAPLLFVQVLYGHFFYTANILLGWRWLAILGVLIVGFYAVYLLDGTTRKGHASRSFALLAIVGGAHGCRGCGPADDEEQIRRLIHRAAEYAEGHETRKILDLPQEVLDEDKLIDIISELQVAIYFFLEPCFL